MKISQIYMEYGNLRTKTFLDFAPSDRAMDNILGGHTEEDKAFFLKHLDEHFRMMSFVCFKDYTDDKELIKAINREFRDEYDAVHNE